jgi:transglutaminase-like putative cysteine protease
MLLEPTEFLDHDTPEVRAFVARSLRSCAVGCTEVERAVALYYAVRDGLWYEVYGADLSRAGMKASAILRKGSGFCMHKSIVYAAAVRAAGIPSRIVLGDVRNHLASDGLKALAGGDVFHHCITSVFVGGRWLKATPVFNKRLCQAFKIRPLEFDGRSDSLYHPHDDIGQRHMEFVQMHGEWDDFPYERVMARMRALHPRLFEGGGERVKKGSLIAEAPVQSASL